MTDLFYPYLTASASIRRTAAYLETGENTSVESISEICENSLATSLALCLKISPVPSLFKSKTQFALMVFRSLGNSDKSQVFNFVRQSNINLKAFLSVFCVSLFLRVFVQNRNLFILISHIAHTVEVFKPIPLRLICRRLSFTASPIRNVCNCIQTSTVK